MRTGTNTLTTIRSLQRTDVPVIRDILTETGVFSPQEIAVALELLGIVLDNPGQREYEISCAIDETGEVSGYTCFGPTPMTAATYDLYWIAVKPSVHHHGIGTELLRFTEETIGARGGRLVIAETSSKPSYTNTRAFYIRSGYDELSRIRNYYNVNDDLVVYGKYLSPSGGT